ncbi:MAG: GNAT family N-acetyltransferase, partial [bacterium]
VGNRAFVELLEEVRRVGTGSPRDPGAADSDFRAMRLAAGNILEATLWQIGYDAGIPVGLVIPQPWPDDPATGDLFVWGVVPEQRGHGWGRVLFERGLHLLKSNWVKRISGSIDATNERAWALYQSIGATVIEKQELWDGPSMS